jgi:uncharacterized membrane protein YgcG
MSLAYNRTLNKIQSTLAEIESQLLPSRKIENVTTNSDNSKCSDDQAISNLHQCIMTITNHVHQSNNFFYKCLDLARNRREIEGCLANIRRDIEQLREKIDHGGACNTSCPVDNLSQHSIKCFANSTDGTAHKCLHNILEHHHKSNPSSKGSSSKGSSSKGSSGKGSSGKGSSGKGSSGKGSSGKGSSSKGHSGKGHKKKHTSKDKKNH